MERFIPQKTVSFSASHPWLDADSLSLVAAKIRADGTPDFPKAARECSDGLLCAFNRYTERVRARLRHLRRGSKQWWRLSKELCSKRAKTASPPLKDSSGRWVLQPFDKANLFARTFCSKWHLCASEQNEFSALPPCLLTDRFVPLRSRSARRVLSSLRIDSGTGPDLISARVLKLCAPELSVPFSRLARSIVSSGEWPAVWTVHWIHPLHKRLSLHDPEHYRGIQLTPQISKAMERFLGEQFIPRAVSDGFFGARQFAYTPERGARDALFWLVIFSIQTFAGSGRVGLYCSDVAGAFDRVRASRLLTKLASVPIPRKMHKVIESWLNPRTAHVVVGGARSDVIQMADMVYQGTVWGPPLWNIFFQDASHAIRLLNFIELVYADDLNALKTYPANASNAIILSDLRECQATLHSWGRANSVVFDAGKEHFHILSHRSPHGDSFKLLGIMFDCQLRMGAAINDCAAACHLRVMSLLRARRFHSLEEMVLLYKSHVLSYAEYRTPAIAHAASSALCVLDAVQDRFTQALGLNAAEACVAHRLAPLSTRRDIAILGIVHRAAIGRGPPLFHSWFRLDSAPPPPRAPRRHQRHLADPCALRAQQFVINSALGAVRVYNILPDFVVAAQTVKEFQSRLSALLVCQIREENDAWVTLFSWRGPLHNHSLRLLRDWRW